MSDDFTTYEYVRTTVGRDLATLATDCYEALGWEVTGSQEVGGVGGHGGKGTAVTLAFRRSRRITNKAALMKLQRVADERIADIAQLEAGKVGRALPPTLALGIASLLVLGLGMSCAMVWGETLFALGIVIGIVGLVGCAASWLLSQKLIAKETARANPLIGRDYEELAALCEEAHGIIAAQQA